MDKGIVCGFFGPPCITSPPPKVIWKECVALAQLCNKVPIGYKGTPQIHPKNCPFPLDDYHPPLIHPSIDRPQSPFQTASGSNQPFCHSTLSGQTDQPTDGIGGRCTPLALMVDILIESDALTSNNARATHYCKPMQIEFLHIRVEKVTVACQIWLDR